MLEYNLTFAGVPFVLDFARVIRVNMSRSALEVEDQLPPRKHQPMAELLDELDRQIPFHYLQDFTLPSAYPGRNLGAIASQWRLGPMPSPDVHINDWYYPNGANRWSVFRGLATSSMAKAMLAATAGSTAQTFVMEANPLSPNNPSNVAANYTLKTQMFMLPPRPLAEHGGQFDGFYLITLVDERYFWQYSPASLHVNANSTWAALISQIGTALGVTINFDPVPVVYQTPEPDSQFWTNQESAPALLDAVAFNIGCTVCRNMDGTYNLRTAVASQAIVNANRSSLAVSASDQSQVVRIAGGDIFNSGPGTQLPIGDLTASRNSVLPASVNITFPKYVAGNDPVPHMVNPRIQAPRPSCWFNESFGDVFVQNVPIASGGGTLGSGLVSGLVGVSGYTHTIHTTAKALLSGEVSISGGTPLNQSGLMALAFQLAADFYNGQIASALDEVYPGTFAWAPEGFHDIIWSYSARTRQAYTRVMRAEWNQIIREMQHSTPPPSGQAFWASGVISGNASGSPVCYLPDGVGGPPVAQTIRDSYASGLVGGSSGAIITSLLGSGLGSGDTVAILGAVDYLPTQNRWWAQADGETLLMEGTSGGITSGGPASGVIASGSSGYAVTIAYRGVRGSVVQQHSSGQLATSGVNSSGVLSMLGPNVSFGVNLTTYEKGQFVYPAEWTSGGIQGARLPPQIQNIKVLDTAGTSINGQTVYSGMVAPIDATQSGSQQFSSGELVWAFERNGTAPTLNNYYAGHLVGYSASGPVSPIYAFNVGGGGGGGGTSGVIIRIGITGVSSGAIVSGFIQKSWADGSPPAPTDGNPCWAYDLKNSLAWSGYYQGTFLVNHSDGKPIYGVSTGPSSGYIMCLGDGNNHTINIVQGLWMGSV